MLVTLRYINLVKCAIYAAAFVLTGNTLLLSFAPVTVHDPIEVGEAAVLVGMSLFLFVTSTGMALAATLWQRARRLAAHAHSAPLSHREMEVVRLIALGLSNKEIAARLYLSPKTVDAHCVRIYRKLDLHDRVSVTRLAFQKGWVALNDPDDPLGAPEDTGA